MKKRLVILALALVMIVTPVFAIGGVAEDDTVGVGLNLGTNTSMLRAFEGDFGMSGDVAFSWNYYTIDGGRGLEFPLTLGVGANVDIDFSNDFNTDFAILFPIGIEYNFAQLNSDVPITVYFRFAQGGRRLRLRSLSWSHVELLRPDDGRNEWKDSLRAVFLFVGR